MPARRTPKSSRLPLPWERENNPFRAVISGRRVFPLVVLACVVGTFAGAYLLGGRRADIRATRAMLHEVERATRAFVADIGRCPRNTGELVHPPRSGVHYLSTPPMDAWGHALSLRCSAAEHVEIEVLSAGPSGSFLDDDNVM